MNKRPTLLKYFLRHHIIAITVTLAVMLLAMLFMADRLAMQSAANNLARQIQNETEQSVSAPSERGGGGRILLDSSGKVSTLAGSYHGGGGMGQGWRSMSEGMMWPLAGVVIAKGQKCGVSQLPWTHQPMVWAARAIIGEDGNQYVLVAWNPARSVRSAAVASYYLIVIAIGLAFLVNMGFLIFAIRGITRTLNDVTDAGRKMVGGDFDVSIPPQTTAELDDLSTVVTDLAQHLDKTLSELKEEQARLTTLEASQRQFVADASHELRAPLSAMIITLDAWQDGLLKDEEKPEALATLRSESKRLGRMVAQLLDLSRIESGRQTLKRETVDLRGVIAQVVESMSGQRVPVSVDVPEDLSCVVADADALHRVLLNLLDNAARFTPESGKITVWAKEDEGRVKVGVTDTGCGIPEESVKHMWDRFARAERERSGGDTGTGLGLAIVKALVEAMDGEVGLESEEGKGTTVWAILKKCEKVSKT